MTILKNTQSEKSSFAPVTALQNKKVMLESSNAALGQQVADPVLLQKNQTGSQDMRNWLILVHPCRS